MREVGTGSHPNCKNSAAARFAAGSPGGKLCQRLECLAIFREFQSSCVETVTAVGPTGHDGDRLGIHGPVKPEREAVAGSYVLLRCEKCCVIAIESELANLSRFGLQS